jgi:hypothetical protein
VSYLTLILVGTLQVTSYRSVPAQTDSTPYITSTGERVHKHGAAVSRDLLCPYSYGVGKFHSKKDCPFNKKIHYGDWLYVPNYGIKVVNDTMNERIKKGIDLWVGSYEEEKSIGVQKLKVYVIGDYKEPHGIFSRLAS